MQEPFAVTLYRRFASGESAERLAAELDIPLERIQLRLRVAAIYLKMREEKSQVTTETLAGV